MSEITSYLTENTVCFREKDQSVNTVACTETTGCLFYGLCGNINRLSVQNAGVIVFNLAVHRNIITTKIKVGSTMARAVAVFMWLGQREENTELGLHLHRLAWLSWLAGKRLVSEKGVSALTVYVFWILLLFFVTRKKPEFYEVWLLLLTVGLLLMCWTVFESHKLLRSAFALR